MDDGSSHVEGLESSGVVTAESGALPGSSPSLAVAIAAYTLDRWALLSEAVESARSQSAPVQEVVLCIDNNEQLLERARARWGDLSDGVPVKVVPNATSAHLNQVGVHMKAHGTRRRFGAGSARNTALAEVTADVIAFIDDDARADAEWAQELLRVYEDPSVVAVGGPPLPRYESRRPGWYPPNFDWVFGCAYEGLPTRTEPLRHLIGANMSVRREALESIGGFVGSDFDDLNVCMRLAERYGAERIIYTPAAVVRHYVPSSRVTWHYFWRRCFYVNREKVRVFGEIGSAANLVAEREFVVRAVTSQCRRQLARAARGESGALLSLGAMLAGVALAGAGNLRGRLDALVARAN